MDLSIKINESCIRSRSHSADETAEIVRLRFAREKDISPQEAAEYLSTILGELRGVAASANLKFLTALIEVAGEEARLQAAPRSTYADIA